MKKVIALFDFDGTLIKGNSLPKYLLYYTTPLIFVRKLTYCMPVLLKYILKLIDGNIAKEKIFVFFFEGEDKKVFIGKARSFSLTVIPNLLRETAIKRLKWHQNQNHDCFLVSASIKEYLMPWAESMGFTKVIATEMEVDGGDKITGKILGRNCKGKEKVDRIKELMGDLKQYEIFAYGDSRGDKEMLDVADYTFYKSFVKERPYCV